MPTWNFWNAMWAFPKSRVASLCTVLAYKFAVYNAILWLWSFQLVKSRNVSSMCVDFVRMYRLAHWSRCTPSPVEGRWRSPSPGGAQASSVTSSLLREWSSLKTGPARKNTARVFGRRYYRSSLWHNVSSVCLSVVCLSVTFCIVAKRCVLAKNCLKE